MTANLKLSYRPQGPSASPCFSLSRHFLLLKKAQSQLLENSGGIAVLGGGGKVWNTLGRMPAVGHHQLLLLGISGRTAITMGYKN